jgi:endonuclease YncB( thermonuclease family)
VSSRTLQHCEQFFRYFPGLKPTGDLAWSHYRYLLRVEGAAERKRWVARIKAENLTTDDVRFALSAKNIPDATGPTLTPPVRGRLYTYRLIRAGRQAGEKFPWYVDCGFKNLLQCPPSNARLHNRYLYTSVKAKTGYALRVAAARTEELYTYEAKVERVIDGDTLLVIIDQGFGLRIKERLRLKGIDAPELSTLAGRRAKHWLENRLSGIDFAVVKTYKTDKYDRYLADVFVPPLTAKKGKAASAPRPKGAGVSANQMDPPITASHGAYLNRELIDAGHAKVVS